MVRDPRSLAFLDGPLTLGEGESRVVLRPLSYGSILLAEYFGLTVVLSGGHVEGLSKQDLDGQLAVYVWMQSAPIDEVLQAAREGAWEAFRRVTFSDDMSLAAVLIQQFRAARDSLDASRFRATGGTAESGIFHPSQAARMVRILTGGDFTREAEALWHIPFTRAMQYDHATVRSLGWRTLQGSTGDATETAAKVKRLEAAANEQTQSDW